MDTRIVLRHTNLGRENQVQEFPLSHFKQITIGRDPTCEIRYDADRDDLVSRQHARININKTDPPEIEITDLNSRNGTYVNKRRIASPTRLSPGDLVQFGAAGPEFQFNIDPPPAGTMRPTRMADLNPNIPPTRMPPTREEPSGPSPMGAGVGRNTVETMLAQSRKRTGGWIVVAAVCVVILIAGAALVIPKTRALILGQSGAASLVAGSTSLSPKDIAANSTDSVVYIEVGWKLIDTESGHQISQVYTPNEYTDAKGKMRVHSPQAGKISLPVFVVVGDQIEPMLTTNTEAGSHAIGGRHSGSGFVVSSDGFILTNRHVAATWNTSYHWLPDDHYGLLIQLGVDPATNKFVKRGEAPLPAPQFPDRWVPLKAKFLLDGPFNADSLRDLPNRITGKNLEGRNDYLDVTFAKNRLRVPGRLTRVSDTADVAMVKVDLPQSVRKVELNDNYDRIRPGDPAIVMGYPGVSPAVYGIVTSRDPFNEGQSAHIIPDPSISVGNIARVIRGQGAPSVNEAIESPMGDTYQLTINSTGPGNSGGPVLDDQGRAVGIFFAGNGVVTFAVPIRYGTELMGINRVQQ